MTFYDALRFLLTTAAGTKIARKSWGAGLKWITKGTYTYKINDEEEEVRNTLFVVTYAGGKEEETIYHANPVEMLADDWYAC